MNSRCNSLRQGQRRPLGAICWVASFLFPLASSIASADEADDAKTVAPPAAAGSQPDALPRALPRPANDFGLAEVRLINDAIRQGWQDHQLMPSRAATDGEWCRRVYLDLIGRVPKVEELNAHLAEPPRDKRKRLVDRLLGGDYAAEFARHWTTVWTNLLVGRTGGVERNSLVSRPGLQQYLREAFDYNKPYDELMRELITATGSGRPGDADFNGAANFLVDKMAERGVLATAKTSQIFLGMAVQCTQCHNHPFNESQQKQFWGMNAFFRQTRVERIDGGQRRVGRIVNRDFVSESGDRNRAEIYFEKRNGEMEVAYPEFVDGTSLSGVFADRGTHFGDRGAVADVNRREELAKLIAASREFDRAIVNRMWAHFLGYGFTKPVDDIGPHNAASHPELLDRLGTAFRDGGFDLKKLMRWIALSEAYGLSSQMMPRNQSDDPALGVRPMFSRFYLRQMEAEQLYESLLVATAADGTASEAEREQMKSRWLSQFSTAFGTDDAGEATTFNGTIPQVLTLMNGDLIKRATGDEAGSMLARVASDPKMDNAERIQYLYLAALARRPTRYELAISNELLAARGGQVGPALQDIWWALLNTNEFILNH
jgi:hypothetical protein